MNHTLPIAPVRRRFDQKDIEAIVKVLSQNELWPYFGDTPYWEIFRSKLETIYRPDMTHHVSAIPTSSGTASIHVALGGLEIPAGSEVIVPPITDMGTIMPVIFQNCIPIFADVDPATGLITSETISKCITERTRAVIVVHLTGSPADMDPINALCEEKDIAVIEDCAQALGATYRGKVVGSLANAGAFSLNSWKHLTSGEGGFVIVPGGMQDDQFQRSQLFADKHRSRVEHNKPEHSNYHSTGLNYRMSDLELALAITQLDKLDEITTEYNRLGHHLDEALQNIPGILPQQHHSSAYPVYFFSWFRLISGDEKQRDDILTKMAPVAKKLGMNLVPSYGRKPIYAYPVFQDKNFFPSSTSGQNLWPAELVARAKYRDLTDSDFDYRNVECPTAESWCQSGFGLYFNDSHETTHLDAFVSILADEVKQLVGA